MSKVKLVSELVELLECEHAGCDDNTCLINAEMLEQFPVHIGDCFSSSGAASLKFQRTYSKLCSLYKNSYKRNSLEARQICKSISHMECTSCNAVIWNQSGWISECDVVTCSSCGTCSEFKPEGNE